MRAYSLLRCCLLSGAAFLFALISSRPASAQFSLGVDDIIVAGRDYNYYGVGGSNDSGASLTLTDTHSWTGLDSQGNTQTMTFSATTFGSAEFGLLRSSTYGTLNNPYYNAANPEYWTGDYTNGFPLNEDGSPAAVWATASVGFSDTFTFSGLAGEGYKAMYQFHTDGTTDGNFNSFALSQFSVGMDDLYSCSASGGTLSEYTHDTNVNWNTPTPVSGYLYTQVRQYLDQPGSPFVEGQNLVGSADFSHTFQLTGIQILNSAGAQVNGWGFVSASSTHYNLLGGTYGHVDAVPEPGTIALLAGMGLAGAAFLRRRKQARLAA